jgi:hypothetical protein
MYVSVGFELPLPVAVVLAPLPVVVAPAPVVVQRPPVVVSPGLAKKCSGEKHKHWQPQHHDDAR